MHDPTLTDLGNDLRDSYYQQITDVLELETRAAWGAVGLDAAYPLTHPGEYWETHVDPATLDLSDTNHCIVGQLYGPWWGHLVDAMQSITNAPATSRRMGFMTAEIEAVKYGLMIDERDVTDIVEKQGILFQRWAVQEYAYRRLTNAWRKEIRARLA